MHYSYPLHIHFKFFALSPQIIVTDSTGAELLFVEQKLLKLKEDVRVYSNSLKQHELYQIHADRILDFDAEYVISDSLTKNVLGSLQRKGMQSLLRASYSVNNHAKEIIFTISESNPWVKMFDFLAEMIPFVSLLTGYFFNPSYSINSAPTQSQVMSLAKQASFTESSFTITCTDESLSSDNEKLLILSLMMMVQLERSRG